MERDILADVNHPFIVKLNYGMFIRFIFLLKCNLFSFVFIADLVMYYNSVISLVMEYECLVVIAAHCLDM